MRRMPKDKLLLDLRSAIEVPFVALYYKLQDIQMRTVYALNKIKKEN